MSNEKTPKEFVVPSGKFTLSIKSADSSDWTAVLENIEPGVVVASRDGVHWFQGEEAEALLVEIASQKAIPLPPYVSVPAEDLKNVDSIEDLTWAKLVAFVDANRDKFSPVAPVLIPGWNDSGLVAASIEYLEPVEVRDSPYFEQDNEVTRKLNLVTRYAGNNNAVVLHHGNNYPHDNED